MSDKHFYAIVRAFIYSVTAIVGTFMLFRCVINPLWGSASNMGMIAALVVGTLGIAGVVILARLAYRDVAKAFFK